MYSSILDQVTFLSVEENESSLYVRAIKVKDGEESFYERELSKNSLQQSKEELAVISSFLENIPVVVWNYEEMNSLFHGCRLKNKILSIFHNNPHYFMNILHSISLFNSSLNFFPSFLSPTISP